MKIWSKSHGFWSNLGNLLKGCGKIIVTGWLILGVTLVIIISLDLVCSFGSKMFSEKKDPNYFKKVDSYKKAPWVDQYFNEFMAGYSTHWKSYVYFRWDPFKGKYFNIDQRGLRLTAPSDLPDNKAVKKINIFMFGGSTLWGWGVRDRYTIPSQLVAALAKHNIKAKITNYSEPGYVNTQELIDLIMQLERGEVPDLVIFYDGVNDVYAAYQSGVAGIPQNEYKRETEYNISNRFRQLRKIFLLNSMDEFCLGKKIKELTHKLKPKTEEKESPAGLENKIVEVYLNNLKIIEGISKVYGFKAMYYWQPVIYYKHNLSKFEEVYNHDNVMKRLYSRTYDIMLKDKPQLTQYNFYDISDIFADAKEPLYIDYCHVDETGNKIIAERMADDVVKLLNK